ncbi:cobalt ABC transporter [Tabrizicola sp. TH137]|uniref:energy-coupling factor ABC transporter ATP-binding protein n=1 Tax=Tabrizicola sp. TH137 TaxID=2067452 RepID=UPI000C7E26BA|nr:ABC transporter ATP-binding protein [Tabrizicola sp. TH137]PLL12558.1 cobalt ABC transporter [Tabrizicola sp. TH137]
MAAAGAQGESGIVLQGASFAIRGIPVLSDLTLTLTEPRIGILGRNGSGKTTLLRLMAGLITPSSGTVRVEGIDPARDRKAMLTRLGILFQNPDQQILFPTVAEELAFGLRQQGHADAETAARAALAAEGRAEWADRPVSTLSQGQRQWLCLLAVLLMKPGTILLDEPFAALDLPTAARLSRRLAALPQRLITISHAPAALSGCDRLLWLEAGRLRLDGPPDAVIPAFTAEMARLGEADADPDLPG